jgi:hypothetical protein
VILPAITLLDQAQKRTQSTYTSSVGISGCICIVTSRAYRCACCMLHGIEDGIHSPHHMPWSAHHCAVQAVINRRSLRNIKTTFMLHHHFLLYISSILPQHSFISPFHQRPTTPIRNHEVHYYRCRPWPRGRRRCKEREWSEHAAIRLSRYR